MIDIESFAVRGRELHIILPPSYQDSKEKRYPVVYVQDAGELVRHTYSQLLHLAAKGTIEETIYVGVTTPCRNDEYTPWPESALLEGKPPFGGGGRAYVDELADLCKPAVDARYRTRPEPEHTAAIGGSFGGLISLFAGLWRPDVFGKLGLLSASFWYEGVADYLNKQGPPLAQSRMYMSVGECEGINRQNIQRRMVEATLAIKRNWLEQGLPEGRLRFRLDAGGTHDAYYMAGNFIQAMQWLFPVQSAEERARAEHAGPAPAARPENLGEEERWIGGYEIPRTRQYALRSARSGSEYRIFVSIPPEPPPESGYPVLYMLDANASFGSVAEAMRLMGRKPHGIQTHVVIGIGYDAEGPMVVKERFRDYTDEASPEELPQRPDGSAWPQTGGAADFTAFITEELKPCMEALLPLDRSRQSLFGHSLGGYFALRMLLQHPGLFQTCIAASPSIWWKNHILYDWLPAFTKQLENSDIHSSLLIGVEADSSKMTVDAEELHRRLLPYEGERLRLKLCKYEGEGHVSMLYPFMSEMLRFL
ncbi:alpha/beta hydrolase-fold protein [Paenibacillus filicis]|uniref:Alpha/beta hydrolase-fold protein n=1 Tax=Paenibacillus filicis TaxID=669464 RepID=A0ABU9DUI6_9BACL